MAWSQQSGLEHNVDYNHTQFTDTHHDHDTNYNYEHHDTEGTYPDHYNETRRTAQHGYLYQEQRHEQQPRGDEQKRRPRRNARARREQYRRAEIRHIEHILKCYDALNHRGNHVSRLGHSIRRALQHEQHTTRQQQERYQPEDDEQPRLRRNRNDNSDEHHVTTAHEQNTRRINNDDEKTLNRTTRSLMPTCKHHLRGTCTFGKYCKFSHESSNEHYDSKTQQHDYDNDRSTDKQEHKEVEYYNLNYYEEVDNEYDYEQQDTQHEECEQTQSKHCNYNINSTPMTDIDIMGNEKNRPTDRVRHQGQPGEPTHRVRHHGQQGEPTEFDIKGNQRHRPIDFDIEGNQKSRPTESDAKGNQKNGPHHGQPGEPTDRVRHHGQPGAPTEFDIMGDTRHRPTEFDIEGNQKNRPMAFDNTSNFVDRSSTTPRAPSNSDDNGNQLQHGNDDHKVLISLNTLVKKHHNKYATTHQGNAKQQERSNSETHAMTNDYKVTRYNINDDKQQETAASTPNANAKHKATAFQHSPTANTAETHEGKSSIAATTTTQKAPCRYLQRATENKRSKRTQSRSSEDTNKNKAHHGIHETRENVIATIDISSPNRLHIARQDTTSTTSTPTPTTLQQETGKDDIDDILNILSLLDTQDLDEALLNLPPHLLSEVTERLRHKQEQAKDMLTRNQEKQHQTQLLTLQHLTLHNHNKKITRAAIGQRLLNNAIAERTKTRNTHRQTPAASSEAKAHNPHIQENTNPHDATNVIPAAPTHDDKTNTTNEQATTLGQVTRQAKEDTKSTQPTKTAGYGRNRSRRNSRLALKRVRPQTSSTTCTTRTTLRSNQKVATTPSTQTATTARNSTRQRRIQRMSSQLYEYTPLPIYEQPCTLTLHHERHTQYHNATPCNNNRSEESERQ